MTRTEASQSLEKFKQRCLQRIPEGAPSLGRKHLTYVIDEHVQSAQMHLQALYDSGLEAGADFAPLPDHASHPKYAFWLEGIRRHLKICESSLGPEA